MAIAGEDPMWEPAGAGADLIVISMPFSIRAGKQTHKAIESYHAGLYARNPGYRPALNGIVQHGRIGLALQC